MFKEDNNNIYLVMVAGIWSGLKILSSFSDVILTNQHRVIKANSHTFATVWARVKVRRVRYGSFGGLPPQEQLPLGPSKS